MKAPSSYLSPIHPPGASTDSGWVHSGGMINTNQTCVRWTGGNAGSSSHKSFAHLVPYNVGQESRCRCSCSQLRVAGGRNQEVSGAAVSPEAQGHLKAPQGSAVAGLRSPYSWHLSPGYCFQLLEAKATHSPCHIHPP